MIAISRPNNVRYGGNSTCFHFRLDSGAEFIFDGGLVTVDLALDARAIAPIDETIISIARARDGDTPDTPIWSGPADKARALPLAVGTYKITAGNGLSRQSVTVKVALGLIQRAVFRERLAKLMATVKPVMYTAMRMKGSYNPNHSKTCSDTGMPAHLVTSCVKKLQAGMSLKNVMATLQEQQEAVDAAAEAASAAPAGAPVGPVVGKPNTKKILIIGGIAAGGALALFLLLRKKK